MKIAVDTHCHSIASGHAYSTVAEMARAARERGLKGFVLTDHGPGLEGGTHRFHFWNLRVLPPRLDKVRVWHGVEANAMDPSGTLDLDSSYLSRLDFCMVGLHELCLPSQGREGNTRVLLAALANPFVDAIAHPGNPAYPIDARAVVEAARDAGKALEINGASFRIRTGSETHCTEIARLCAETGCPVCCGSDAHWAGDVGRIEDSLSLLKSVGYAKEGIINLSMKSFEAFLARRKAEKAAAKG